ncbi:hypothetical protein QJS10_CPB20g01092 [Acorus calamus]|uniref:Uncharacterized protein n=1 Tax=Acorus calamus TaxID=4465 RepID=A0AAV9CD21_ACOCL|nr:hypothetical protein QJS10_CPB20g01092 [Acorus calamus]
MESIRRQASKFREQVAKQQQAVLKQFSVRFGNDFVIADEDDIRCHEQLQKLYNSTKAAKRLQRDIARGVEALIAISSKQMDIAIKLAGDCCKYGTENEGNGSVLARAALHFGTLHNSMEREREALLKTLADQVFGPLRAMITSAPLEDARHLTHRYERLRQEVESQVNEVVRRQLRSRDAGGTPDNSIKLQHAESKLSELKSAMSALGREATAAMLSVEDQQQQITFQRLLMMVDAERTYHRNSAAILDKLHAEMILEKQHGNLPESATTDMEPYYLMDGLKESAKEKRGGFRLPTLNVETKLRQARWVDKLVKIKSFRDFDFKERCFSVSRLPSLVQMAYFFSGDKRTLTRASGEEWHVMWQPRG